jgi:hypothetical protein
MNEGVNLTPRGQISPLGAKFTPRGEIHPWGQGVKLRIALSKLRNEMDKFWMCTLAHVGSLYIHTCISYVETGVNPAAFEFAAATTALQ